MTRPSPAERTLRGRISTLQQAHVFLEVPGKRSQLFDVEDGDQIVVYASEPLPQGKRLALTGKVLHAGGGPPGSKAAEFHEEQLDVTTWKVDERP